MSTTLHEVNRFVLREAFDTLGVAMMDSPEARQMLLTIGLQESGFIHTRQMGDGPARGYWQFELGTEASRGGVWGVYLHPASRTLLSNVCALRGVPFNPRAIWQAMEADVILAACVARLLLWTDPKRLPALNDPASGWAMYADRTWRPGKPHPAKWRGYWEQARAEVERR